MKSTVFIPKKIKVGFNKRSDTYTGKLGYVIYHDGKVWRKETSWESWRSKNNPETDPLEFDNVALEGFVLNKKVGGYKSDWNFRQAYCRVYDPRGFEFEITIPNLLYILENANSIKGKGLEGKFIYGWDAKDLVLLPEEAPEYKEMIEFTETLSLKVSKKDLKVGGIYLTASGDKVTYLTESFLYDYSGSTKGNKVLWFYKENYWRKFDNIDISSIKKYIGDNPDVANILDDLEKHEYYNPKKAFVYKYEPYTIADFPNPGGSYYSRTEVYIPMKGKNKYKRVYLSYHEYGREGYDLCNGMRGEYITEGKLTKKELLEKYPIYKQIRVEKDED